MELSLAHYILISTVLIWFSLDIFIVVLSNTDIPLWCSAVYLPLILMGHVAADNCDTVSKTVLVILPLALMLIIASYFKINLIAKLIKER